MLGENRRKGEKEEERREIRETCLLSTVLLAALPLE